MWVSRLTSGDARWVRSPRPVSVTAWTVSPAARSIGTTNLFHDQAPPHAPCTITKVATAALQIEIKQSLPYPPVARVARILLLSNEASTPSFSELHSPQPSTPLAGRSIYPHCALR